MCENNQEKTSPILSQTKIRPPSGWLLYLRKAAVQFIKSIFSGQNQFESKSTASGASSRGTVTTVCGGPMVMVQKRAGRSVRP